MSCLKDEQIQKFIDGESTEEEAGLIEKHLAVCGECAAKVRGQKRLAVFMRKNINSLAPKAVEIPAIAPLPGRMKRQIFSLKKLVYMVSAACIILFVLFISHRKEIKNKDDIFFNQYYDRDSYNANHTLLQQPLVIHFYDGKGNVKKYNIE